MLWEYYRLSVDGPNIEKALHNLGQKGWELVAVIPETRIFYGFQCFLKRPLTGDPPEPSERTGDPKRLTPYVSPQPNSSEQSSPEEEDSPESLARMTWKH
ncbi:hypothetical protein [Singulisphaera acidiphila]|uniref:DUF4177 domain-containing protein n=1 Tax=Singulisphaera acidiphila (strain ATCC BAA-1392 / DSM 18658 / VKM B-2454 / MOB10) TaxID=886293 RepID=L0DIW8_SINAD|nr:hypothetical protein [Singulisphaera acidiphila]AGA29207.1 hypothetical protein Sinac_5053 [Singulisphaera acidiphila DSM 18658]